jgi:formylglycine-generating enzyme required for sulfatase activity
MKNMRPLMKIRSAIVVVGFLIWMGMMVWGQPVIGEGLQALKAGVVKITTKTGQVGTGFIVRIEPEMVYIITAAHVIAGGDVHPEVEFFTKRNVPVKGAVLPGAEVNDDLRGLALVVVHGSTHIPDATVLPFEASGEKMSGREEALVIGHPGGGGDWTVVKRNISNRVGRDMTLDPDLASRFSGGPIIVHDHVVGIVMSNRDGFGLGITHKSVLDYLEGFQIKPGVRGTSIWGSEGIGNFKDQSLSPKRVGNDEAPMVLVPEGDFTMGSPEGEGEPDEHPQHIVHLDNFYIDQYEVTVEQYRRFMKVTNRPAPDYWDHVELRRDAKKPVVAIDWQDAHDYCEWAGKRLPTEAEWEKASRGTDKRTYPWGEFAPNSSTANFGESSREEKVYEQQLREVGSYERGKSPYEVYDMAGNVWEWVQDWYGENYYQISPRENPPGPPLGEFKVLRGGSWDFVPKVLRTAYRFRFDPTARLASFGFRCAQDAR